MKNFRILFVFLFVFGFCAVSWSQSPSNIDNKILYRKERSAFIEVHTGGWGLGYRTGKHITGYKKRMFEFEAIGMKHPKELKITSYYENSRNFIYGKLNSVFILRGGYGRQRVLNGKPYWGGVEVRFLWFGGVSIALAKPVYLYIVKYIDENGNQDIVTERYDPYNHAITDIYGRASFFKGFDKMSVYPGAYFKTGLSFEYGADDRLLKSLECGIAGDIYPKAVPIMAFNKNNNYFLSLYLSLHIGKRKN
ncbi:MAG: hypothetical protein WCM76_09405 [Bacteroidota bacterium]